MVKIKLYSEIYPQPFGIVMGNEYLHEFLKVFLNEKERNKYRKLEKKR
jgi:hypothetical protein